MSQFGRWRTSRTWEERPRGPTSFDLAVRAVTAQAEELFGDRDRLAGAALDQTLVERARRLW
jgi:hypothetical protein